MSLPTDKELDDYLLRRSDVSRRYRALANDEPPAELDQAVLARARAAVDPAQSTRPESSSVSRALESEDSSLARRKAFRWAVPLTAAATLVMSVVLLRGLGPDLVSRKMAEPVTVAVTASTDAPTSTPTAAANELQPSVENPTSASASASAPALAQMQATPVPAELSMQIDGRARLEERAATQKRSSVVLTDRIAGQIEAPAREKVLPAASTSFIDTSLSGKSPPKNFTDSVASAGAGVSTLALPPAPRREETSGADAADPARDAAAATAAIGATAESELARSAVPEILVKKQSKPSRRWLFGAPASKAASQAGGTRAIEADSARPREEAAAPADKPRPPAEWLDAIRRLRADGRPVEADEQLKRFLMTYADYFEKNPTVTRP